VIPDVFRRRPEAAQEPDGCCGTRPFRFYQARFYLFCDYDRMAGSDLCQQHHDLFARYPEGDITVPLSDVCFLTVGKSSSLLRTQWVKSLADQFDSWWQSADADANDSLEFAAVVNRVLVDSGAINAKYKAVGGSPSRRSEYQERQLLGFANLAIPAYLTLAVRHSSSDFIAWYERLIKTAAAIHNRSARVSSTPGGDFGAIQAPDVVCEELLAALDKGIGDGTIPFTSFTAQMEQWAGVAAVTPSQHGRGSTFVLPPPDGRSEVLPGEATAALSSASRDTLDLNLQSSDGRVFSDAEELAMEAARDLIDELQRVRSDDRPQPRRGGVKERARAILDELTRPRRSGTEPEVNDSEAESQAFLSQLSKVASGAGTLARQDDQARALPVGSDSQEPGACPDASSGPVPPLTSGQSGRGTQNFWAGADRREPPPPPEYEPPSSPARRTTNASAPERVASTSPFDAGSAPAPAPGPGHEPAASARAAALRTSTASAVTPSQPPPAPAGTVSASSRPVRVSRAPATLSGSGASGVLVAHARGGKRPRQPRGFFWVGVGRARNFITRSSKVFEWATARYSRWSGRSALTYDVARSELSAVAAGSPIHVTFDARFVDPPLAEIIPALEAREAARRDLVSPAARPSGDGRPAGDSWWYPAKFPGTCSYCGASFPCLTAASSWTLA
jgi:hypothetical protein